MTNLQKITEKAIKDAGGGALLSRKLGGNISRHAIYQWSRVPAEHVHAVESITGIPRHKLRPDLYPAERERVAS
jgi:DNA-binding transcriptional regulator YdaS (Cro superfamily)